MTLNLLRSRCLYLPLLLAAASVHATPLGFDGYLQAVDQHSLALAAQRQQVVGAEAGIGIAGLRPDPELSWEGTREQIRGDAPRPWQHGPTLGWTVETGGKRRARIGEAHSALALAVVGSDVERHAQYREAAHAFAEACRTGDSRHVRQQSLQALQRITDATAERHRAGDIGGVDVLRARLERDQYRLELRQADTDADTARLALAVPLGRPLDEVFGATTLDCAVTAPAIAEDVGALLPDALQVHDQVRVAAAEVKHADATLALTRANRWVDPTVSVGVATTRGYPGVMDADGQLADALPRSRELTVALSVPLPISRRNRGDLVQASAAQTQAVLGLRQAELVATTDVRNLHQRYLAARDTLASYQEGLLDDARQGVERMRLSYQQGASSLLELLDAQRSTDEIQLAYLQARADLALASAELQLAVGQRPGW